MHLQDFNEVFVRSSGLPQASRPEVQPILKPRRKGFGCMRYLTGGALPTELTDCPEEHRDATNKKQAQGINITKGLKGYRTIKITSAQHAAISVPKA